MTTSPFTGIDEARRQFARSAEDALEAAPGVLAPFSGGTAHADVYLQHGAQSATRRRIGGRNSPSTDHSHSSSSALALNVVSGTDAFHEWIALEDVSGLLGASAAAATMIHDQGSAASPAAPSAPEATWVCPDETAAAILQACTDALRAAHMGESFELALDRRFSEQVVITTTGDAFHSIRTSNRIIVDARSTVPNGPWRLRRVWELAPEDDIEVLAASVSSEIGMRLGLAYHAGQFAADETTVVFAGPLSTAWLHEAIGHTLEADAFFAGPFAELLGRQVGPKELTVVDDAQAVDDEGCWGGPLRLVDEGRIINLMADQRRAHRYGITPTANGFRADARSVPLPRMRRPTLLPGSASLQDLIAEVRDGVLVDIVTSGRLLPDGTVALRALGHRIQDGRVGGQVRGMTLHAHAVDFIRGIRRIASDNAPDAPSSLCVKAGQVLPITVNAPSVLIEGIGVS